MALDSLFDREEQKEIREDVAEAIKECEELKIPINQRRYFSILANKYGLVDAIIEQLRTIKKEKN
jgi:hypothetical protein